MGAMSADSDQNTMVTGVIAFAQRPTGPFTVTVLVEDVSRADAPSTIVGGVHFENPAFTADEAAELPFSVSLPRDAISDIRRLNLRVHVRVGHDRADDVQAKEDTEARQKPDSCERLAHSMAREHPRATTMPDSTGRPDLTRPDVTEGDFVSTQSHPVRSDPARSGLASVRIPVLRV